MSRADYMRMYYEANRADILAQKKLYWAEMPLRQKKKRLKHMRQYWHSVAKDKAALLKVLTP